MQAAAAAREAADVVASSVTQTPLVEVQATAALSGEGPSARGRAAEAELAAVGCKEAAAACRVQAAIVGKAKRQDVAAAIRENSIRAALLIQAAVRGKEHRVWWQDEVMIEMAVDRWEAVELLQVCGPALAWA